MSELSLSDPLFKGNGMGVAWGIGNTCSVWAKPKSQKKSNVDGVGIHQISWETSLFAPIFRKLVNESSATFLNLQKVSKEDDLSNGHLVHVSKQYRSILRDCQERLEDNGAAELLYKLELIWNLMEILHIEKSRIGTVLPHLSQWISLHFTKPDELAVEILSDDYSDNPESHPQYWDALILFLLQGRNEQAQRLLALHSHFNSDPFISLDELIRKIPVYNTSMNVADFDFRWNHWQSEVISRIDDGDFSSGDPNLALTAQILAGQEKAFIDIIPKTETWYQWMIGKLLYTNPVVKSYDLSYHAEQAISHFGGLKQMNTLDTILLATMEWDIPGVMHELCTTLDNFWFPAHLLDLIHHVQMLEKQSGMTTNKGDQNEISNAGLREFLLLDYGTCLMSHRSLWQVGVLYLDHCPLQGKYRLELLLERMPLDNEVRANKVITLASERGISSVVISTCKVMGMRMLKEKRIGAAMAWGLRSQDVKFTTFLADTLLTQYCDEGGFSSTDLLDNLGSCMMVSDRLTFLAKYREFHKLCANSDFRTAANLLHSLLWSRLAPKYFWVTLLIDASSFLNVDQVLFSSEQIYELMHCLQELCMESGLPKKQKLLLDEHEGQIRMKLAKNLAMALMDEGDVTTCH